MHTHSRPLPAAANADFDQGASKQQHSFIREMGIAAHRRRFIPDMFAPRKVLANALHKQKKIFFFVDVGGLGWYGDLHFDR